MNAAHVYTDVAEGSVDHLKAILGEPDKFATRKRAALLLILIEYVLRDPTL